MFQNKYLNLVWLMRNERRSSDELRHIQNTKLVRLIQHAYENVKMYRDKFSQIGLHPEDIQTIDDIHKIPIIDKHDFHQRDESDLLDKRLKDKTKLFSLNTSGSSGLALRFYIDHPYDQFRKAQFLRPYLTNGNGLFNRVVWIRARPNEQKKIFQRLGVLREHQVYSGLDPEDQINIIKKVKPSIIKGYGSSFSLIASKILEDHILVPAPRLIFTDSELLTEQVRQKIEKAFHAEVIDIYGTFETDNIAYECSRHEGYHIAIDCVIMEFLRDGKKVKPGEEGEIVCTILDNLAMPFIRYNLHDLGCYTDKNCSCGRTFPLMSVIAGRTHDYAVKENGLKVSSTTIMGHLWPLAKFIYEIQLIQEEINSFTVLVVPSRAFSSNAEQSIKEAIWKDFPNAKVNLRAVNKITREESGKFREFKSMIVKSVKE